MMLIVVIISEKHYNANKTFQKDIISSCPMTYLTCFEVMHTNTNGGFL